MGTKGVCHWTACRIEGETKWRYEGPTNDANIEEQKILIGAFREGRVVNHGDTMIDSTYMAIMGQMACYTGKPVTWERNDGRRFRVRTQSSPTCGWTWTRRPNRTPPAIIPCRCRA